MGKIRKKMTQKRQWRKIDTSQLEDALERKSREERQGLAFERVPDVDLFFEDKGGDEQTAAAVAEGQLPAAGGAAAGEGGRTSRKLAARQKVLRSQAILAALGGAAPPSKMVPRKPKGPADGHKQQQQQVAGTGVLQTAGKYRGKTRGAARAGSTALDLWGEEAPQLPAGRAEPQAFAPAELVTPAEAEAAAISAKLAKRRRTGVKPAVAAPHIPALEIDAAGCSFNPDRELHQEAVATAVAGEMQKILNKELQPAAPPRTVDYDVEQDELAMLQTLEAPPEEEVTAAETGGEEDDGAGAIEARGRAAAAQQKKTQKDRNREKRRRVTEEAAARAAALKKQRRELDNLKTLQQEVEEVEEEAEARRARRAADRADRAAAQPPKLGKLPFEPMPLQVLTSGEVSGSLRRLKPTTMLAKDRFKSLQKRGAIEPRKRIAQHKAGKKVEFVRGERGLRAAERQAEIEELRAAKKKAAGIK